MDKYAHINTNKRTKRQKYKHTVRVKKRHIGTWIDTQIHRQKEKRHTHRQMGKQTQRHKARPTKKKTNQQQHKEDKTNRRSERKKIHIDTRTVTQTHG